MPASASFTGQLASDHRDGDDLLTAGLGLAGLQAMVPPAFADPAHPTAAEARPVSSSRPPRLKCAMASSGAWRMAAW